MKIISFFILLLVCTVSSFGQTQWGLSLDYLFEGEGIAYVDPPNVDVDMSSAIMLRGEVGFPWGSWLIGGPYLQVAPSIEVGGYEAGMFEVGFFLGPHFEVGDSHEMRFIAKIGYRQWFQDDLGNMKALGTNLHTTFIFNRDNKISPVIDLGFNAQPAGGNDDYFFSHDPQAYLGGGIIIHTD